MHMINQAIFSFNFVINIIVAFMALMVAYYSYRCHKVAGTYDFGYFSLGFLSLATSFLVEAFSMIVWAMNAAHITGTLTAYTYFASMLLFRFFLMLGLVLILFATKNLPCNSKGTIAVYLFMLVIILSLVLPLLSYLTSIILLIIIAEHYFRRVIEKRNNMSLYLFIAMVLLIIGVIRFFFIIPYFCVFQPILFFLSFLIVGIVVIKAYKN